MSRKDDLDRYDREWRDHTYWRQGRRSGAKPGKYVDRNGGNERVVNLGSMSEELRKRVDARLDAVVERVVLEEHAKVRLEHVRDALAEAKASLAELVPVEAELAAVLVPPDPGNPEIDAGRLKKALDSLGGLSNEVPVECEAEAE